MTLLFDIMTHETYKRALDKRIKDGKVFLNNKRKVVTAYEESEHKAIVVVGGKDILLGENDVLIISK